MTLTIINLIDLIVGLGLGMAYLDWSIWGIIAHSLSGLSTIFTSFWIWFTYAAGTAIQFDTISPLGTPYGPEEPNLSIFYNGTLTMKWITYTTLWLVPAVFAADIFMDQPSAMASWWWWSWFDPDNNNDQDYSDWDDGWYDDRQTRKKKTFRSIVAGLKGLTYILNISLIAGYEEMTDTWYSAARMRSAKEQVSKQGIYIKETKKIVEVVGEETEVEITNDDRSNPDDELAEMNELDKFIDDQGEENFLDQFDTANSMGVEEPIEVDPIVVPEFENNNDDDLIIVDELNNAEIDFNEDIEFRDPDTDFALTF